VHPDAQAHLPMQDGASLPVVPDASLGNGPSALGRSRSLLKGTKQTRLPQPVALRSTAMALQPGPGSNCIANEDSSAVTMLSGSMTSFVLECIPREGTFDDLRSNEDQNGVLETRSFPSSELVIDPSSPNIGDLNASHNKENQTNGELRQAKSIDLLASRSDAESSASSTPNVYIISPSIPSI
jgi:hypothetical protein